MRDPIAEIAEKFWAFENKNNLLNQKIDGVFYWPLVRFKVFNLITNKTGIYDLNHPRLKKEKTSALKIKANLQMLIQAVTRNPFLTRKKNPYVIMPHQRHINGKDIYSDYIAAQIPDDRKLILYNCHLAHNIAGKNLSYLYLKRRVKNKIFRMKSTPRINTVESEYITSLEDDINTIFNCQLDLFSMIKKAVASFKLDRDIYESAFKRIKPKAVLIVCAYGQEAVVAACQNAGIRIDELQHGVITHYHMAYSYPGRPEVAHSPDRLLCFGPYWKNAADLARGIQTEVIGAEYLKAIKDDKKIRTPKQVLVLSQGTTGKDLFNFTREAAKLNPDYSFIFHPHPNENKSDYIKVFEGFNNAPTNLLLSSDRSNTYDLLKESEFAIGVNTTALFEAMSLGNKVIVVSFPGYSYMTPAIKRKDAVLCNSPLEMIECLDSAKACTDPNYYYSKTIGNVLGVL